ncbi:MAG TPA: NUDIX domain-containing protein [Ktedonobacterales bacterium]|nr:NUDIX domain-containing protein [Ktedonobacterales bacterium]
MADTPAPHSVVPSAIVSVDIACFTVRDTAPDATLALLLVRRSREPFADSWALPGGIVHASETCDAAAERVLKQRTGLEITYLEQLYTFSDPRRDPRGRTIAVTYYALVPERTPLASGADVTTIAWHDVNQLPTPLAFDHEQIAHYARQRLAQKVTYAPIVFRLLPPKFTMHALRHVYAAVEGKSYDHISNFTTMIRHRWPLEVAGATSQPQGMKGRPPALFRYAGKPDIPGAPTLIAYKEE